MTKADVDLLVVHLEDKYCLAEGTVRNYKKALRGFFEFRDEDWYEEIVIGASPDRKHDPDEELDGEEIDAMLEEGNARDRALIALLADTGLRIGGVLSLRIRDLDVESDRATVSVNSEANVKDDDGPKPVTWSRSYVASWLQEHPRSDDPTTDLTDRTDHRTTVGRRLGTDDRGREIVYLPRTNVVRIRERDSPTEVNHEFDLGAWGPSAYRVWVETTVDACHVDWNEAAF